MNQIHDISWDFDIDSRLEQAPLVVKVGDRVRFKYATGARHNVFFHNVVEVPQEIFYSCDMTGIESELVGFGAVGVGGIDTIELSPVFQQPGTRYFVCSLDRHCESGMKIAIEVVGTSIRLDMQPSFPKAKCDKCGRFESGAFSCCAPGGTWHRNCGDNGEHTWSDGAEACESKLNFFQIGCQYLCRHV